MSNILTHDASEPAEVVDSRAAEEADSLRVGEELAQAQEQLLAGKYRDAQELEKAYLELQTKLGDQEKQQPEVTPEPTTTDKLAEAFKAFQSDKGLQPDDLKNFDDVSKEDIIKAFFENTATQEQPQSADNDDLTDAQLNDIYNRAGGQEAYQQMIQWAAQNLSAEETAAFDQVIDSGDMIQINFAVDGIVKRFNDVQNQDGQLIQGKAVPAATGYRSQAELIRDMSDPRYETDPAYRNDIMEKLANSPDVQF